MEEEKKTPEREEEQALPVQELPTDIPAEVRQKLAEDLNEQPPKTSSRTSARPKKRRPTTKKSRPTPRC